MNRHQVQLTVLVTRIGHNDACNRLETHQVKNLVQQKRMYCISKKNRIVRCSSPLINPLHHPLNPSNNDAFAHPGSFPPKRFDTLAMKQRERTNSDASVPREK